MWDSSSLSLFSSSCASSFLCVCVLSPFLSFLSFLLLFFLFAVLFFLWPFVCRSFTFTFTVPYPYHISRVWSGADWGRRKKGLAWESGVLG